MSDILKITVLAAPWQGINYSVSWDGRGTVAKPTALKAIWDCAFKACSKGYVLGFSFVDKQAVFINSMAMYDQSKESTDYLIHLVNRHGGITSVGFAYREEAEEFVEELDKIIMWKLLKREFDEQ